MAKKPKVKWWAVCYPLASRPNKPVSGVGGSEQEALADLAEKLLRLGVQATKVKTFKDSSPV